MRSSEGKTGALAALLFFIMAAPVAVASSPGEGPWRQYADVRDAGFNRSVLDAVYGLADEAGSGALFVVRDGAVVLAWGEIERKFKCHSVRKSFLSALYGAAVAKGDIRLEATLLELGIDDLQGLTEAEMGATVEQLIQSRSGVYHPAAKEPRSMKKARPERGSSAPGENFWYNNWDFNTAGHVFEMATGRGIFQAFEEDLAQPLGMEDFTLADTLYQYERRSSRIPAYAFRLSARDAARFGVLYLQDGAWGERRLIPAAWIERNWTAHSDQGDGQGYGYMWWIYGPGTNPSHAELTAYAARATGSQLIVVVPSLDLVVVHRADTDFARGVRGGDAWNRVWEIVDSIEGEPSSAATLVPVAARRFTRRLPPLSFPETVLLAPKVLDRYVGRYRIGAEIEIELRRIDDALVGSMTGMGETDFFATSETEFWSPASGATMRFELDAAGGISQATLRRRGQEMVATPIAETTTAEADSRP